MNNKKFLNFLPVIIVMFIFTLLPGVSTSAALAGEGTEASPYLISNMDDFYEIPNDMNGYYKLTNDIDMYSIVKEPIDGIFSGVLDGNGYKIKNMKIIGIPDKSAGLFLIAKEAAFKNLTIDNAYVKSELAAGAITGGGNNTSFVNCTIMNSQIIGLNYVGALVGSYSNNRLLVTENCKGIDNIISGSEVLGGLVGMTSSTTSDRSNPCVKFVNCYTEGGSVSGRQILGGLVGYSLQNVAFEKCHSSTPVKGSNFVGGILGEVLDPVTFIECYTTNTLTGRLWVGGLVGGEYETTGRVTSILIENCYSTSEFSCPSGSIGGLAGLKTAKNVEIKNSYYAGKINASAKNPLAESSAKITYSYFDSDLTALTAPASQARTTAAMYKKINYTGWDFQDMWYIEENADYPKLRYAKDIEELIPVLGFSLEPKRIMLNAGDRIAIEPVFHPVNATNKNITWISTEPSSFTVDNSGVVSAVSPGYGAIIAITADGNYTAYCNILVIEFEETKNLALEATASSNSSLNTNRSPDKAIDDNMDTSWIAVTGAANVYLQLDFNERTNFKKMIIHENGTRIKDFNIEKWNGSTWEIIHTGTSMGNAYTIDFSSLVSTDKIRINFITMQNANAPSIKEIELYK